MGYSLPASFRRTMSVRRLTVALSALVLAACGAAPSPLVPQLREQFRPGMTQAVAEAALHARGTTYSVRNPAECAELANRSAMTAQLQPRGGICIFGKIPLSKNWLGGSTDVILQLVFTSDGKLADGNFEEIENTF